MMLWRFDVFSKDCAIAFMYRLCVRFDELVKVVVEVMATRS